MSAIPAFLIPALTGFALSKLTGQSTKSSLRNALLGGLAGGITSGFSASQSCRHSRVPSDKWEMLQ
jgi:VIT1/CCC1 family predicted Fe2+/Mn2+ transporter